MKNIRRIAPALALLTATAFAAHSAQAVVLEQKFQAGQQLSYDVALNGDMTLYAENPSPGMMLPPGIPITIKMTGTGQTTLKTVSVDAQGAGTVQPMLNNLALKASTFGQKFELGIRDEKGTVLWNGRTVSKFDAPTNATTALRFSKLGRIEGVASLVPAANTGDKASLDPQKAMVAAMAQAMILRSLPAFWPGRDVQEGEKWSAQVAWPLPDVTPDGSAANADAQAPLGNFDFKLGPQEEVGGHMVRRVQVLGSLALSPQRAAALATLNPPADKDKPQPRMTLVSANQKVGGNLWFDPILGRIVRAELELQTGFKGKSPIAARDAKKDFDSSVDFTGTLQMQLRPDAASNTP